MVRRLMRTAAKTAVISGTATAASGRVARRQQQKFARDEAKHAQAAPQRHAPAHSRSNSGSNDMVARLQQLAELRASGALSEKEFSAAKAKLLAS